jgi:hypothetical protein
LSTFRVALSDETPQEVTLAFPAERLVEPSASVAAAAHAVKVAAIARPNPNVLVRRFM